MEKNDKVKSKEREVAAIQEPDDVEMDQDSKLVLKNFNKYDQKVFINGKSASVDYMGQIDIPFDEEVTIRVEAIGKKHFVIHKRFESSGLATLEVPVMPYQAYGYLKTGRRCIVGTISFMMFGEKRVEKLPIRSNIGLPLEAREWEVTYQREGETITHAVKFLIEEDKTIDFCEKIF